MANDAWKIVNSTFLSISYSCPIQTKRFLYVITGVLLCMRPANEWRRYIVTSSLIGWAHAKNGPWIAVTGDISVSHTSWTCTTHITVTSHQHPAVSNHLEFHASTSLLRLTSIFINITAPHERLLVSGVHRWPVNYLHRTSDAGSRYNAGYYNKYRSAMVATEHIRV